MDRRYDSAGEAGYRMLQAQERRITAENAAWARRSWLSKALWIVFH